MLYRPSPSVTTVRTRSIKAGLEASTVTPGNLAPDVSVTNPAMPAACCAHAAGESSRKHVRSLAVFPIGPASTERIDTNGPTSVSSDAIGHLRLSFPGITFQVLSTSHGHTRSLQNSL